MTATGRHAAFAPARRSPCALVLVPGEAPALRRRSPFWLSRFSNGEVVHLAWALDGAYGSVEAVAVWRRKVLVPVGGNLTY
jgi:hypothetical protein